MSSSGSQSSDTTRLCYRDLVSDLTYRYPILQYLNFFLGRRSHPYPVRAAVLEFHNERVLRFSFEGPTGYNDLFRYLSSALSAPKHRLFIIEDLDPTIIELLGSYLNVDGTVFASQIRDAHFTKGSGNGHVPKLPSFHDPSLSFTLRYYEGKYFKFKALSRYGVGLVTAANVRRQIQFAISSLHLSPQDVPDDTVAPTGHVGTIRRNTSFWSRKETDGSWNGVMLVDPAIHDSIACYDVAQNDAYGRLQLESSESVNLVSEATNFQRGYRDFTPWPSTSSFPLSPEQIRGPQRVSLLDDICHYWQNVASSTQIAEIVKFPELSSQFQLHITASIWMNTMENLHALLSELETTLWELERMIAPDLTDETKKRYDGEFSIAMNELNTLRRRLNWYVPEMEQNLFSLGLFPNTESPRPGYEQNFLAIYNRLLSYQRWSETLLSVVTSQVNLMETTKSIADSKSLSRLTILGFIFVPISFISSFFSMNGDFAVGENKFWIYFVVTIPLTLLILATGFWKYWLAKFRGTAEKRAWNWPYRMRILR